MTIAEAITAVLSASHRGDQHFHSFLMVDEAAELRAALVALADAARGETTPCYCRVLKTGIKCGFCLCKGMS